MVQGKDRPVHCPSCGTLWLSPLSHALTERMGGCPSCGAALRGPETKAEQHSKAGVSGR